MPCVSLRLDLDLTPNFQEVGRRKIKQIDRSTAQTEFKKAKSGKRHRSSHPLGFHARLRRVRRSRRQCRDRRGSRGLLPAEEECADASSCPLFVAHQLTASVVVGSVAAEAARAASFVSSRRFAVVIGEARGPWKIANRPSGYSCTRTVAPTKCGRSGPGGICRVSPRHLISPDRQVSPLLRLAVPAFRPQRPP